MNIVIVEHERNGRHYMFSVPDGVTLKKSDRVLVRNKFGLVGAECCCDSFEVDEEIAKLLTSDFHGSWPLSTVEGRYFLEKLNEEGEKHPENTTRKLSIIELGEIAMSVKNYIGPAHCIGTIEQVLDFLNKNGLITAKTVCEDTEDDHLPY